MPIAFLWFFYVNNVYNFFKSRFLSNSLINLGRSIKYCDEIYLLLVDVNIFRKVLYRKSNHTKRKIFSTNFNMKRKP